MLYCIKLVLIYNSLYSAHFILKVEYISIVIIIVVAVLGYLGKVGVAGSATAQTRCVIIAVWQILHRSYVKNRIPCIRWRLATTVHNAVGIYLIASGR